jgi:hypothetical protein
MGISWIQENKFGLKLEIIKYGMLELMIFQESLIPLLGYQNYRMKREK